VLTVGLVGCTSEVAPTLPAARAVDAGRVFLDAAHDAGLIADAGSRSDVGMVADAARGGADTGRRDAEPAPVAITIPDGETPCAHLGQWPESLMSQSHPYSVHYPAGEMATAQTVVATMDRAWSYEVVQLGFTPPPGDGGDCGPDDRLDVFLWPGQEITYVEQLGEILSTPHEDATVFMVVDPWAADIDLAEVIHHELNHACHAGDDWWEPVTVFEMSATYVESLTPGGSGAWAFVVDDFQAEPTWSLDRDDEYATWYMYGAALYLRFLEQRYFGGDPRFVADMWRSSRNPPGDNEPDWIDALDQLLRDGGNTTFVESVVEFARWRWFTGTRADAQHLTDGADYAEVPTALELDAQTDRGTVEPMVLGSAYVTIRGAANATARVRVNGGNGVTWSVQSVDGDTFSTGSFDVPLGASGAQTLVITALPRGTHDPDDRTDDRYSAMVRFIR